MEELLAALTGILFWRVLLALAGGVLVIAALYALVPSLSAAYGFTLMFLALTAGIVWESVAQSPRAVAAEKQPISRPVAFLGMTLIGGLWGTLVELATGSVAVSFAVLLLSPALSSPLVSALTGTGLSRQQIVIATLALLMGYAAPYVILVVANGA